MQTVSLKYVRWNWSRFEVFWRWFLVASQRRSI